MQEPTQAVDQDPRDSDPIRLFLCGDVMTGRGIDQVLPHPGSARICESGMASALGYVALAEKANGPIPKPVDFSYVWGDSLAELEQVHPDLRIVNLENRDDAVQIGEQRREGVRARDDIAVVDRSG
jgi:poly-gamma-glutamate synthesis protein (capsule biosynthesis protein)